MATFTPAKNFSSTFVRGSKVLPQLEGHEGQKLSQKITEVSDSIQKSEFIRRLLQSLEAENKKKQTELMYYISSLRSEVETNQESDFTISVLNYSWEVWQGLSKCFAERGVCLEVPDACPGQSDNFMYTWSKTEHYLECEIFGNGAIEFFYKNRKTGEVWGEDTTLEHKFSTATLEKAALFVW
jgi:hypothetical protein